MTPPTVQFIPGAGAFLPTDISGLKGWWDYSDTSTLTIVASGGFNYITVADDKSGNTGTGAAATSAMEGTTTSTSPRPDVFGNGLDCAFFDNANDVIEAKIPDGMTSATIFLVCDPNDTGWIFFAPGTSAAIYLPSLVDNSSSTIIQDGSGSPSYFLDGTLQSWATRDDGHAAVNGAEHLLAISGCDLDAHSDTTSDPLFKLGGYGVFNSDRLYGGLIGEIIVYNSTLTQTEREKVEGYLAHKWGLSANLPASHPYKSVAP